MEDITKTGPVGLEGLEGIDKVEARRKEREEYFRNLGRMSASQLSEAFLPKASENIGARLALSGYGQSTYDDAVNSFALLNDLNEVRAQSQPGILLILGGIGKGISLAATTFLNGTAGALVGLATGIVNSFDGDPNTNFGSGFWDNWFSRATLGWNDMMEEALPSYYSELDANVANWIGDKFLKNVGFAVGAYYSGAAYSALLRAARLPALVARAAHSTKAGRMFESYAGSLFSAVNEGSIEALNNSTQWYEENKASLDQQHSQQMLSFYDEYQSKKGLNIVKTEDGAFVDMAAEEYKRKVERELAGYQAALKQLDADRIKMGNADMLLNIPILTWSNHLQFAKMYARGFKTGRRIKGVAFREGEKGVPEAFVSRPKLRAALSYGKSGLAEGAEEVAQKTAAESAGSYYTTHINNFYKAKTDRQAEMETLSTWKALADGINKTVNDSSSWEEFIIGGLTGLMGIPIIRSGKAADGSRRSPIVLEGGFRLARQEYLENQRRALAIVDRLNTRIQDPKFKAYYQGLVRHRRLQDVMDKAVTDGDEFEFKNAEHSQFISDIIMFDTVGRLDDLKDLIRSSQDYSDENISSVIETTSSTLANGRKTGPFIKANGSAMSNEEAAAKLKETTESMLNDIDNYIKIKDDLDSRTDERFTDEQLEELTWMKSQMNNWAERSGVLAKEIQSIFDIFNGELISSRDAHLALMDLENQSSPHRTKAYDKSEEEVRNINDVMTMYDSLKATAPKVFAKLLSSDMPISVNSKSEEVGLKDYLIGAIQAVNSTVLTDDQKADYIRKINDAARMSNMTLEFADKYNEYLAHPEQQQADHEKADQEAAQTVNKEKVDNLKSNLSKAKSIAEFKQTLDKEEDEALKEQVINDLEKEGNKVAKNYKETTQYDSEFRKALQNSGEDAQTQQDALTLWEELSRRAEDVESLANSEVDFDENTFLMDSGGDPNIVQERFQKAKYALQKTISTVNNDIKFRDRFAKPRSHPSEAPQAEKPTGRTAAPASSEATASDSDKGKSQTRTRQDDTPVGDKSSNDLLSENDSLINNAADRRPKESVDKDKPKKRYIRPVIPEIHITASRDARDFRPYDVVVAEKESGVDFSEIYEYLREHGAFDYVNEGRLKPDDVILFMIDPEFEEKVKDKPWHKAPTVFMVTEDGQIVGSLDEGSSMNNFEGLPELIAKVRQEYKDSGSTKRFVASPKVKVAKIMVGKVPYSATETNLSEVEGVKEDDAKPIFGIVKNGILVTNKKIDPSLIRAINDVSNKEGALYLLVPNPAGTYNPVAVRTKHFNANEFNINDATVANTPIGKQIIAAINQLADCQNEDDLKDAVSALSKVIYNGTLHINWISDDRGGMIQFIKVEKDKYGNEVYEEVDGKRKRKEDVIQVYFTKRTAAIARYTRLGKEDIVPEVKDHDTIVKEITDALLHFNLPIQVSVNEINTPGYNLRLISSGVLTSNIKEAKVISNWFVTDYIDSSGKVQKAVPPTLSLSSPAPAPLSAPQGPSPVGGNESVVNGVTVKVGNLTFIVDREHSIYIDANGKRLAATSSNKIIFDLAWALENYGDATESSVMTDNKIITPDGDVLDRTAGKYLRGEEAQRVKDKINGVKPQLSAQEKKEDEEAIKARVEKAEQIEKEIEALQQRVDRSKTDGNYWYIEEEDGELHPYERIHKRLGDNWRDEKLLRELATVQQNLQNAANNKAKFEEQLKKLESTYEIDLSEYKDKGTDKAVIEEIVNKVQEAIRNKKSKSISTQGGTAVDAIIREFFVNKDKVPDRPDMISEEAFKKLLSALEQIRAKMESMGETFYANNLVLFHKYADDTRIAGEVDILAIDKEGNFKIYDVKTSKYNFDDIGKKLPQQTISTEQYYTLQLSGYQNLLESEYGVQPIQLALMPFELVYTGSQITGIRNRKGIILTYDPSVNTKVPLEKSEYKAPEVQPSNALSTNSLPIFSATIETMNPKNRVLPENAFENTDGVEIGYYEYKGKIYKGYLKKIAEVNGTPIYVTKVRDMGFDGETPGNTSAYYMVTPNGASDVVLPVDSDDNHAISTIKQAVDQDPAIIDDWMSDKTKISEGFNTNKPAVTPEQSKPAEPAKPIEPKPEQAKPEDKSTGGAAESLRAIDAVNKRTVGRRRHKLREATDTRKTWNKKQELSWLARVLPQMSELDRVKLVKGLIYVADLGAVAWGMFGDGIITLSDIAAEGTTYHEAFHVIFNLMLSERERAALFDEARKIYGNKSILALEEDMAEGFREYVMSRQKGGLLNRIKNFFSDLWIKVSNWHKLLPHLYAYYQRINQGKYSKSDLGTSNVNRLKQEEYTPEMLAIKEKAIADGTFMKTPKGKPTKLNERQWLQVRTKNFINWFGDWINNPEEASKVVDEGGEPLVVYHHTNTDINVFDKDKTKDSVFWFTSDKYGENIYYPASTPYITQSTYNNTPVFLNLRNPAEVHGGIDTGNRQIYKKEEHNKIVELRKRIQELANVITEEERLANKPKIRELNKELVALLNSTKNNPRLSGYRATEEVVNYLNNNKNDGFVADWLDDENFFVTINSNQIKSAEFNTGEFSTTNDDIRYRLVDSNAEIMRKETLRFLDNFNITIKEVEEFGGQEKLFDALNRTINIRNVDDISEGVGEAIAFMMQHNSTMQQLIRYRLNSIPKSVRRSIKNRGDFSAGKGQTLDPEVRKELLKEIGSDIATELRKLYNVEAVEVLPKSFLAKLWEVINEFFNMLTPDAKTRFNILKNYTKNIANSIKLNDPSIILTTDYKPGTTEKAAIVNIGKTLQENPYEKGIVELMTSKGIALAGSASIALEGTLFRPSENPLHDLDFNAGTYNKEELNKLIKEEFSNSIFIREIVDGKDKITETYLVLDRPFATRKPVSGIAGTEIYDKETGKKLGSFVGSKLFLEEGIKGKFLDFFMGEGNNKYPYKVYNINGKSYLVSDARNAFIAKIEWARPKDVWDYNRFNTVENLKSIEETRLQERESLREKFRNARIIWGHPAIGKTTYLEKNLDILEWDLEVNPKRNEFLRDLIDPEHKLDIDSKEYKQLSSSYMAEWRNHPEYIKFLTDEWEALKRRAQKEGKRLFASPAPLLEIGRDDFDLFINIPEKVFLERNTQRKGTRFGSMGWKQIVNEHLTKVDPDKIVFTDKYFSDFIEDILGVLWDNFSTEQLETMTDKGWTKETFESISPFEREHALQCMGF